MNRNSGKALDVYNWSTANGAEVVQWTDGNGANQQWRLADSPDGHVRLLNRHSGKALEVQGASTADGGNVVQYDDWGGANQQWQLVPVDSRRAALLQLCGELAAAVIADLLGVHIGTAIAWSRAAGRPWADYIPTRT